jgi:hypothetical protein
MVWCVVRSKVVHAYVVYLSCIVFAFHSLSAHRLLCCCVLECLLANSICLNVMYANFTFERVSGLHGGLPIANITRCVSCVLSCISCVCVCECVNV